MKKLSQKSIISLVLISIGIILNVVISLGEISVVSGNPAFMLGMILPGIFLAVILGLVLALIVQLFSKDRTKEKFFLIFSIFFLLTSLIIAFGS